jgi:hypothetical protein
MGERTGIGVVEATILEALDSLGGQPSQEHVRCEEVLSAVEERIGLAPGYAYEVLLDLALPWKVPIPLISKCGNFGSRGNAPAANFRYTEARLSPAGQVALAAERGEIAPVPIGLINGNSYREGTRPPFRPDGVMDAIRVVTGRPQVTDEELTAIIGPPDFLTGCRVIGEVAALAAGRPAILTLLAHITIDEGQHQVVIENIPPNVSVDDVQVSVAERARMHEWVSLYPDLHRAARLPIEDVRDFPSGEDGDRFACIPEPGTPPELLRDQLKGVYGISTTVPVALPQPLPDMVRQWVTSHESEDLLASMAALEHAIRRHSTHPGHGM